MTPESLVIAIAKKVKRSAPPNVELDDLIQSGSVGLLEAQSRYRAKSAKLTTFAAYRIRGAILDELRKMDVCSRRSDKLARLESASEGTQDYWKLGMDLNASLLPLAEFPLLRSPEPSPFDLCCAAEKRARLYASIARLPGQQRDAMESYLAGNNLEETAKQWGRTPARVSQVRKEAIGNLRESLK